MSQTDTSNYEVIRRRLLAAADELTGELESLNEERKRVFGGSDIEVSGSERVRTENNCVPRDIVSIGSAEGNLLLFGYNVFIGLKQETTVADVFGLHRFEPTDDGYDCSAVGLDSAGGFLQDPQFVKDFGNLYRYYREASLLQLVTTDTKLLAVFQSGTSHTETKVFRWNIESGNRLSYVDDRGERDYVFSRSHDFEWTQVAREQQVSGRFPHYQIENEIFIDNLGGTLTVKVENNTESGAGIFEEPLADPNQVLDDAQFFTKIFGSLIVVKVLPFRETEWRTLVYDRRHRRVSRIDAIEAACQELPEDHGIIFPGGYFLQNGESKVFDADIGDLEFVRSIRAPNGEDVVYVYHRRRDGHYSLLFYNLIRKQVQTPIECHGYSLFQDGRMVVFRALSDEPTRVHPMQVWATPFSSLEFAASVPTETSFLAKVGNAELVRGVSDGFSVARLAKSAEPNRETFEDIVAQATRLRDNYYWVKSKELEALDGSVAAVGRSAEQIVDEFEKVVALRAQAAKNLAAAEEEVANVERSLAAETWSTIDPFLEVLTSLRRHRGQLITMRDVRYMDVEAIAALEQRVVEMFDRVSRDAVSFLLRDDAFAPLNAEIDEVLGSLEKATKVADVAPLKKDVEATAEGLALLGEVMANIEIEDVTQRTTILERITEVFAHVNAGRQTIENRHRELRVREGKAEFGAQLMLLSQTMSSSLTMCDTPEACDEQMARVIVSLEELESRFSDVDEFVSELADKREDIAEAFSARKQTLLEARQRRAQTLLVAADRILEGVGRRARLLESADDLNGFFAADAMVMKLRQLADELAELGDTVKSEEIQSRLLAAKQNALRSVRDRVDLFDEEGLIRFGSHQFGVNKQPLELTLVPRGESMSLHLAGSDFYEEVTDVEFSSTRDFWQQGLVSETEEVYRAEYLAYRVLKAAEAGNGPPVAELLTDSDALERAVSTYATERYDEGYERGIHDRDGLAISKKLLASRETVGLLRFSPVARGLAQLFWAATSDGDREQLRRRAQSRGRLRDRLGVADALSPLSDEIETGLAKVSSISPEHFSADVVSLSARYLAAELSSDELRFITSANAEKLGKSLADELELQRLRSDFDADIRALVDAPAAQFELAHAWLCGHAASHPELQAASVEAAAMICAPRLPRLTSSAQAEFVVDSLLGHHPRIQERRLPISLASFLARLDHFENVRVPAYRDYRTKRAELIERENFRLRPEELRPRVMTSFVRNQLISDVYLPLIGDNLAKQIGAAGAAKRTDLMGLLLLISPPGYGKTTLMEYVADQLGLAFVKINGPSIGHSVRSLDPEEAPNATARAEVEKINLALEMGNNVMLYLDDIQHTHPELLQKFISLCDAQRRIEGVWRGRTRTYDLRGKKFCVVMAGNPYTESGGELSGSRHARQPRRRLQPRRRAERSRANVLEVLHRERADQQLDLGATGDAGLGRYRQADFDGSRRTGCFNRAQPQLLAG